jgi:hypothetical protein
MRKPDNTKAIGKLKDLLKILEEKHQVEITAYHHWLVLTDERKKKLREDWDEYYQQVKTTPSFALFKEMSRITRLPKVTKRPHCDLQIHALRMKAQRMLKENDLVPLKKPSSFDPLHFVYSDVISQYKDIKKKIDALVEDGTYVNQVQAYLG